MNEVVTTKRCSSCGLSLPRDQFSKASKSPDGLQYACKACNAAYVAANRERIRDYMVTHHRFHNYGLTAEQYADMLARQHNRCASCSRSFEEVRTHIDHNHRCCPGTRSCGKCVRGILCPACNTTASHVENGRAALVQAYLEGWAYHGQ